MDIDIILNIMATYLSLIPRELNELVERYVCDIKVFMRLMIHGEGTSIVEYINDMKTYTDIILIGICGCCKKEAYTELAKIQDENIIMVYLDKNLPYTDIIGKTNTLRGILIRQFDPKKLHSWVNLKAYSIRRYNLVPPHLFRQKLTDFYYNHIRPNIEGVSFDIVS